MWAVRVGASGCLGAAKHRLHCMRPRAHRFLQGSFPMSARSYMGDWRSVELVHGG